jgi:hypothetical protein
MKDAGLRISRKATALKEVLQNRMRPSDMLAVHAAITTGTVQGTTFPKPK